MENTYNLTNVNAHFRTCQDALINVMCDDSTIFSLLNDVNIKIYTLPISILLHNC